MWMKGGYAIIIEACKTSIIKTTIMRTATKILFTGLFGLFLISSVAAQSSQGPFEDLIGKEIRSDNIFLLWQELDLNSELQSYQKVFRYDFDGDINQNFSNIPTKIADQPVSGNRHMAVASGKFIPSLFDHVVAAWEGENQTIELMVPQFDTTEVMWNSQTIFTVDGPVVQTDGNNERGRIFIKSGDMNGNGSDEFALVYHGADSTIHIEVYELDENLTPHLLASINDEELLPSPINLANMSVAVGDVNGNGRDEIILSSVEVTGSQSWAWGIYVKNYELDDTNTLTHEAKEIIFLSDPDEMQISGMDIAVETGNFRDTAKEDIVLAMTFSTNAFEDDTFIYLIQLDEGTFNFDPENRVSMQKSINERSIIDLAVGDLNNNNLEEFVFGLAGSFEIYSVDAQLTPEFRSSGPIADNDQYRLSYEFLDISELNQDQRPEIISARNVYDPNSSEQWFEISAYSVHDSQNGTLDSLSLMARRQNSDPAIIDGNDSRRRYALATGSFNGYTFRLGEPLHYRDSDNVQPLVILNAPPVHFDIFNDTYYDINQCYSGSNCNFTSVYEEIETTSSEVSIEVKSDYGFSIGAGLSGSIETAPMGVGGSVNFEAYFDKTYGKNFSKTETEGEKISVFARSEAVEDDRIYATVTDYDVWEYPVYHGDEEFPRRFAMAVEPREVQSQWYSSKSWNASNYIPDHEVGNIFSYPSYSDVSGNEEVSQAVHYFSDTFELDANTNDSWTLDFESFTTNEADTTYKSGYDAKLDAIVRVKRDYTGSDISTHTTTVRNGLQINVSLGSIDRSIGENRFNVTPYAYWARNGALVVDYAASPERSGAGGTPTWWEQQYGQNPDPAFILPWRYDPEKGFGISEELKRYQTKDIFFDFDNPEPGDTLTITAKVRNFSLVGASPITVHFYVGDPDNGGELITGINGETSVTTTGGIEAQRFEEVNIQWKLPVGLTSNPRIFAVLNQDSAEEEIHTNNNKGFNILGQSGVLVSNEPIIVDGTIPGAFKLHQSYPNPFNPTTNIGYELPQSSNVRIDVFNIVGQRVSTLVNERQSSGYHEVRFDASGLASGVYLYRLSTGTGQFTQTRKFVLMK